MSDQSQNRAGNAGAGGKPTREPTKPRGASRAPTKWLARALFAVVVLGFQVQPVSSGPAAAAVIATTTDLQSSPNPSGFGAPVTFTATVTSPDATPVGTVTFTADGNALGSDDVDENGVAVLSVDDLAVGSHLVVATFTSAVFATSSDSVTHQVDPAVVPGISAMDATTTEADSGTTTVLLGVQLSEETTVPVTVDYTTADATALATEDYATTAGTLEFSPGTTLMEVPVEVVGDTRFEAAEKLKLILSSPAGGTLVDGKGVLRVTDNDPAPALSVSDVTQVEGDAGTSSFVFTLSLSAPSGLPTNVYVATADGTAKASFDYTPRTAWRTIQAGASTTTFKVAVNGDTTPEDAETFKVRLHSAVNATIADGKGVGTITNDD